MSEKEKTPSIGFTIKHTLDKAKVDAEGIILRYSGSGEPFKWSSERLATARGKDGKGDPVLVFNTGLEESQVQFYYWYNDEEKKKVIKDIKALRPLISEYFGGDDVISNKNSYFWLENEEVNKLSLTNSNIDTFYDTKNPVHALLYLSLLSGAFIDIVAPTREWADRTQTPSYMALSTDKDTSDNDEVTKSDAHGALYQLKKESDPEALFILAWCMQYDTNAFGAYLRSTPFNTLVEYHIDYINGKLVTKQKKNTARVFIDYAERWNGQQTRPSLFVEAYVKAGDYYDFINQREKKYTLFDGTVLGNTIKDAVDNLQKPKFQAEFDKLKEKVEAKWAE